MPKAAVNGIEIHYELQGKGDPVMLITGLGGSGWGWGPQIPRFAKEFLTIVPDHRGAGQSSHPEDGYTIEQHASDMAETLRGLGCGPTHVIGSSTGGAISQVMALDHPDVVRTITVVSSWAKTDDYFRLQFEVRKQNLQDSGVRGYTEASALFLFAPTYIQGHYDAVKKWMDATASAPSKPEIMAKRIDMIIAHDQKSRLGNIQKPALVIVGKEDFCTPSYLSKELAGLIPGSELAVLAGGHFFYKERPGAFYRRVRNFLLNH
jgi:aminoacrylate hydrolase